MNEFDTFKPPISEVSPGASPRFATGGFHQFFWNPTGVLAPEALSGFRSAGCSELAAILERALSWFDPDYPREHDARVELLDVVWAAWRENNPGLDRSDPPTPRVMVRED